MLSGARGSAEHAARHSSTNCMRAASKPRQRDLPQPQLLSAGLPRQQPHLHKTTPLRRRNRFARIRIPQPSPQMIRVHRGAARQIKCLHPPRCPPHRKRKRRIPIAQRHARPRQLDVQRQLRQHRARQCPRECRRRCIPRILTPRPIEFPIHLQAPRHRPHYHPHPRPLVHPHVAQQNLHRAQRQPRQPIRMVGG